MGSTNVGIIEKLKEHGMEIEKSNRFYIGFYSTEKGVVVSKNKDKCEDGIYFLQNDNGTVFGCNEKVSYVIKGTEYEGKVNSQEEAAKLAREGKIFAFKSSDLYAEYYDFPNNPELENCFWHKYSLKSRTYIESVMEEIGFISYTQGSTGLSPVYGVDTEFKIDTTYRLFVDAETEVGLLSDGVWIAQTDHQFEIDDYTVIKMYFNHKPSENDIRDAFAIRQFELEPVEVFTCEYCGKLTNWLDIDGGIYNRYILAKDRCCGCKK